MMHTVQMKKCDRCGFSFCELEDVGCPSCLEEIERMRESITDAVSKVTDFDELDELSGVVTRHLSGVFEDHSDLESEEILELEVDEGAGVHFMVSFHHPAFGKLVVYFWRHWNNFIDVESVVIASGNARFPLRHDKLSREERLRLKAMLLALVRA